MNQAKAWVDFAAAKATTGATAEQCAAFAQELVTLYVNAYPDPEPEYVALVDEGGEFTPRITVEFANCHTDEYDRLQCNAIGHIFTE